MTPFHERFLANIERNTPLIRKHPHIGALAGKLANRAALIGGAGPGLELNAHLLRGRRDIVLFACDRARDRIRRIGIAPQYTVTTDPSPATAAFINEPGIEEETLLASVYASPEILALPWKEIVFYNSLDKDEEYNRAVMRACSGVGCVPGAMIVSNFAYLLADAMGCSPIGFIGNDMCAPQPEPGWTDTDNYLLLELSDGRRYHTLKSFLLSIDWMDKYIASRRAAGRTTEIFNCSESGIFYSDNIPAMSLADFIKAYEAVEQLNPTGTRSGISGIAGT